MTNRTAELIDLAGEWRVALDRTDAGRGERWFARSLAGSIPLPGSLETARLGDPVTVATRWTGGIFDQSYFTAPAYAPYREPGNIKVPFWLQPETHYTGAAWYQRPVEIPAAWAGRRLVLTLERPHWRTAAWLGDHELGSNDALSIAHVYDLGAAGQPGRHTLTVRVDNRLDPNIGENSHSVSDHTQGNWNGIVGRIELAATAPVWIDELDVITRIADRTAHVRGRLGRVAGQPWLPTVQLAGGLRMVDADVRPDGGFDADCAFGPDAAAWDEFTPALHTVTATLANGEHRVVRFGFRELSARGRQLMINGRKLFLRGTLDCAIFPRTGHPPTDPASWRREFGIIRAHGLNHVRFHSWCPPEAAFTVADELGMYLQVEVASWPNYSTTIGDGKPVDAWLEAETGRILRAYGNHPSFVILCAGNEPAGEHHAAWLSGWVARRKQADPRRLYTAGAGWPEVPESDLHIRSEPRIQHWEEGLGSRINAHPPETRTDYGAFVRAHAVPVVAHEIGQWCAYPNFAEMSKYTGYLKPRNFEVFQATAAAHGLAEQTHDFLISSGRLQMLCYKEEIEAALRTPEFGGFQLLGLQDFPGQGTALVGVLDAFWEEKGYVTPAEFRRFCNHTVPLARLDRRVFTVGERLQAEIEIAHFGAQPLLEVVVRWQLLDDDGHAAAAGVFPARDVQIGAANHIGRVDVALTGIAAAARYRMVVSIDGTALANDWDVWVYPASLSDDPRVPADVTITPRLDDDALTRLNAGQTVWLMLEPEQVRPDAHKGPIALGFSSIFWNTAWTNGQPPHTLGVLCDPRHPAFAAFPTEAGSNWQWWYPIQHAAPMILDAFPRELRPVVQVVDDWFTNRKLGLVFEARIGPGRLLVSSIAFGDPDPVRHQLRSSLLGYLTGPRFQPEVVVTPDEIRRLVIPGAATGQSRHFSAPERSRNS